MKRLLVRGPPVGPQALPGRPLERIPAGWRQDLAHIRALARLSGADLPAVALDRDTGIALRPDVPLPVVDLSVNGFEPVPFLVDTGASTTVVSAAWVTRLGITTDPSAPRVSSDGAGGRVHLVPGLVDRMDVGDHLTVLRAPVEVIDLPPRFDVAGLLAPQDTLRAAHVELDMRARVLRVRSAGDAGGDGRHGDRRAAAPVSWEDGRPVVHATVGGSACGLVIDSGAGADLLCAPLARRLGALPPERVATSYSAAGAVPVYAGLGAEVAMGDALAEQRDFLVQECASSTDTPSPWLTDEILGAGWLGDRRVAFDPGDPFVRFTAASRERG